MRNALASIGLLGALAVVGAAHADVRNDEWAMCLDAGRSHPPEDAATACTEFIQDGQEATPTIALAHVKRGESFLRGGHLDQAKRDFDHAILLDIHSGIAFRGRAEYFEALGNYPRAIRDFDHAGELTQNDLATFAGRCRARAEANVELPRARTACNAGLAISPTDPDLLTARGLAGMRQGRFADAQRDFDAAIQNDDHSAAAYYGRGLAATKAGGDGSADLLHAAQLDGGLTQRYAALDLAHAAAVQTANEQVVVTGLHTDQAVRNFVTQIAVAPRDDRLARWDDRGFCPSLLGLQPQYAQFVLDRVTQRAQSLGLDMGRPGCRSNVIILISPHPDVTAHDLFQHNRRTMGYYQNRGQRTLGRDALTEFLNSNAPVRWWHVSRVVSRDGDPIGETVGGQQEAHGAQPVTAGNADTLNPTPAGAPVVALSGGNSRVRTNTHDDFGVVYVIVDAGQLGDTHFEALSDYLAMVSLAQFDPDADTASYPTILNLFTAQGERPQAMTDWDVAYLQGLYHSTQDARNFNQQRHEIVTSMGQALQTPSAN